MCDGNNVAAVIVLKTERGADLALWCSVGPLHSDRQYDISASKEGFVLSPVEGTQGDFKAFALAGVTFTVQQPFTFKWPPPWSGRSVTHVLPLL